MSKKTVRSFNQHFQLHAEDDGFTKKEREIGAIGAATKKKGFRRYLGFLTCALCEIVCARVARGPRSGGWRCCERSPEGRSALFCVVPGARAVGVARDLGDGFGV